MFLEKPKRIKTRNRVLKKLSQEYIRIFDKQRLSTKLVEFYFFQQTKQKQFTDKTGKRRKKRKEKKENEKCPKKRQNFLNSG